MIRGAGRLNKRMDERGAFATPGEDAVVDGRHLMPLDDPFDRLRHAMAVQERALSLGRVLYVDETMCIGRETWEYLRERAGLPREDEIARMEDEGGPPC